MLCSPQSWGQGWAASTQKVGNTSRGSISADTVGSSPGDSAHQATPCCTYGGQEELQGPWEVPRRAGPPLSRLGLARPLLPHRPRHLKGLTYQLDPGLWAKEAGAGWREASLTCSDRGASLL